MYTFGTYSYNYTSQIRALLSTIFKFAISRKYLSNNPVKDTEIALKIEDKNKQREKIENKYLERDEAEKIISYLANKKGGCFILGCQSSYGFLVCDIESFKL